MIDVNCLGLLYCTHAALPLMREEGAGHIVNVSSVAGRVAALGSAVYNMTKWGVVGFSEGLRQEALHANVRVTDHRARLRRDRAAGPQRGQPDRDGGDGEDARADRDPLQAADIADAILHALTRPQHVAINEVLIRPTKQSR